jgi:hypothetical protein
MKQRNSNISFVILGLVVLVMMIIPASAQSSSAAPQLPQAFYGTVEINGSAVAPDLSVEATGPGVVSGIPGNPITTTYGSYGAPGPVGPKLLVQGDMEAGTPIEFYVGGVKAEVFPVATNGPWLEAYPYLPGDVTELNLRIVSQPSAGGTREPTPVQTRIPSGQVPTIPGYIGPALPQPEVIATYQPGEAPADSQATAPGQEVIGQPASQGDESPDASVPGGQETGTTPPGSATTSAPGMLTGTAIVAFLVIIGAAVYQSRKKPEDEEKEE